MPAGLVAWVPAPKMLKPSITELGRCERALVFCFWFWFQLFFFCLKDHVSDIIKATPAFFWLVFALFLLSSFLSLCFRYVFCFCSLSLSLSFFFFFFLLYCCPVSLAPSSQLFFFFGCTHGMPGTEPLSQ